MGGKKGGKKSKSKSKTAAQKAAAKRHAKFKQTRVQTFGGKKTSFTKAEKKRIEAAGYSVAGYSKAAPRSDTAVQISKDIAKYGNTVPSGSFGISAEGRAQAEANRKEAAAKAAAEATRKSTFDANRLSFNMNNNPFTGQSFLAGGYNQPGRLGSWFDKGLNIRVPNEANASFGRLFSDDMSQLGKFTDKSGKVEGGLFNTGIPKNFRQVKQLFSGKGGLGFSFGSGIGTGPTPLGRQTVRRFLPYATQIGLGRDIFNQGATDSATTNLMNNINTSVTNLTGGRLTADNPETDIGARAGRFFTSLPGKVINAFTGDDDTKVASAGGLNIGGGVDSGDAPKSNVGRVLTFGKNLVQQPKALAAFGVDVANQLFSPKLADGTLTGNMDFAGNLPGDKGFDNRDVQIKSAINNAMDSRFVQQYGENLGLPKNFKAQTKDALAALSENYQGATADRDGIYTGTSETLKNLSSDKRLAPIAKFLNQLGTDNENVTDADRNKKFSMMGFQTPIDNETAADIITAFQPNVEKMPGLSTADRGLIEGGGGNRLISGKLTDIGREALIGDKGSGETLGLTKGSPLTIGNMIDAGSLIASNLKDSDTLASKRSAEIQRLANQAGKITTPSLIKGLIPKFGGSGSFRPNAVSSLGGGATTLASATPKTVEEVLPLPTTTAQGGTNATDLAQIQQQAYNNQLSVYGMNPNYFANIIQPRFNTRPKRFRQVFNRGYF